MSGLGLAVGINLLILFILLTIGVRTLPVGPSSITIVDLINASDDDKEASARPAPRQVAQPRPPERVLPPPRIRLPTPPAPNSRPLDMLIVTPQDYAAADIGKIPKASGSVAGDSEEVGRGPNGQILFAAEWARRPTATELGGYLPRNAPAGYGMIACKTAPQNRVEDCVEIGQAPLGSRLASAVRQAAWQFRVRPPRKNGRPMIGEWVRIRIDYLSGE